MMNETVEGRILRSTKVYRGNTGHRPSVSGLQLAPGSFRRAGYPHPPSARLLAQFTCCSDCC